MHKYICWYCRERISSEEELDKCPAPDCDFGECGTTLIYEDKWSYGITDAEYKIISHLFMDKSISTLDLNYSALAVRGLLDKELVYLKRTHIYPTDKAKTIHHPIKVPGDKNYHYIIPADEYPTAAKDIAALL